MFQWYGYVVTQIQIIRMQKVMYTIKLAGTFFGQYFMIGCVREERRERFPWYLLCAEAHYSVLLCCPLMLNPLLM